MPLDPVRLAEPYLVNISIRLNKKREIHFMLLHYTTCQYIFSCIVVVNIIPMKLVAFPIPFFHHSSCTTKLSHSFSFILYPNSLKCTNFSFRMLKRIEKFFFFFLLHLHKLNIHSIFHCDTMVAIRNNINPLKILLHLSITITSIRQVLGHLAYPHVHRPCPCLWFFLNWPFERVERIEKHNISI